MSLTKPLGIGDIHHAQPIGSDVVSVAAGEIVNYRERHSRGSSWASRVVCASSDIAGAAGNEDVLAWGGQ